MYHKAFGKNNKDFWEKRVHDQLEYCFRSYLVGVVVVGEEQEESSESFCTAVFVTLFVVGVSYPNIISC